MIEEYYILEQGQKIGPFTADELLDRPLEPDDMVLMPWLSEYKPAHSLSEFDAYFKDEGIYYPSKSNTIFYLLRLFAFIIDIIILSLVMSIIGGVFFPASTQHLVNILTPKDAADMEKIVDQYKIAIIIGELILFTIINLYNALCEMSGLQGSIGKYVFGLAVVDHSGYRLTFGHALKRNFWKLTYELPSIFIGPLAYILNLSMIWKPLHQAFHDQLSGCYIIKKNR